MPKNIVIFSDGTGQEGGKGHNTNVYKLFNMIVDRDESRQIGFYDRGLGTGFAKFAGNVFGIGISQNILDCYRFIFENYSVGDKIYLFGFSRGATTVRSLSGFIHHFGLLPKSRPELIPQAYRIYKTDDPIKRTHKAQQFIERHHTMWVKIQYIGVWDTVVALGVPWQKWSALINKLHFFKHKFHDLSLSPSIIHGRHALAIDDRRREFHPTLWDKTSRSDQTMKQVWFSGMHTDVGGGYKEQGLSDVVLDWMIKEAVPLGLEIYDKNKVPVQPDFKGAMHDSRDSWWKKIAFIEKERTWDSEIFGKPVIHQSVIDRANDANMNYQPWILQQPYDTTY